ncbi:hypothetical protein KIPB_016894, partial [Kipferlia bialata]
VEPLSEGLAMSAESGPVKPMVSGEGSGQRRGTHGEIQRERERVGHPRGMLESEGSSSSTDQGFISPMHRLKALRERGRAKRGPGIIHSSK